MVRKNIRFCTERGTCMLTVKSMDVRDNFKSLCDKVFNGETLFISRPKNENVVMLSESEYNEMVKAKRNADYLSMIDKSIAEAEAGGFVAKTLAEPQTLKHVDEVLKLLSVFGEDRRFTDTVDTKKDGKEVSNMCEWLDIVEKKNFEQGIEQGIEAFILDKLEDNCSEDEIIARLQKRFKLTEERAKAYFEKYGTVLS